MTTPVIDPDDLATYLQISNLNTDRAELLIKMAQSLCQAQPGCNPLPAGAEAVVLDVTARAFTNPTNADQQTTGPFSVSYGAISGGLWLTAQNKSTLRRLAGLGNVSSLDMMPATAGCNLPPWDMGYYYPDWSL